MPCVIMMIDSGTGYLFSTKLNTNLIYIVDTTVYIREISTKVRKNLINCKNKEITMKVFKFLVELLKNDPPVIVDISELQKDPTEYIKNFNTKKNQ